MSETINETNNPWQVKAKKDYAPLPSAMYVSTFKGVSDFTSDKIDGIRWKWVWEVSTGPFAGRQATALTDRSINANTISGRLIRGLLGRELQVGEMVKDLVDACIGKTYMIVIEVGAKGGKESVRSVAFPPQ